MYPSPKVRSGDKHVSWHVSQSDVGRLEEAPTLFALPWMIQCDQLLIPTFGRVLGYLLWKALLSSGFVRPRISNLAASRGASTGGLPRRWEEPRARVGRWHFPTNEVPPWNFNPLLAKEHRRKAWAKWVNPPDGIAYGSIATTHYTAPLCGPSHAHLFAPLPLHKHILPGRFPWWFYVQ